jgi:hypothetical protein
VIGRAAAVAMITPPQSGGPDPTHQGGDVAGAHLVQA